MKPSASQKKTIAKRQVHPAAVSPVSGMKKVTVNLPATLLEPLDGMGTTELIRHALKEYRHRWACQELLKLQGKVKFDITYEQLKSER